MSETKYADSLPADERVEVIFVTKTNHVRVPGTPRRLASDWIRSWWNLRECVLTGGSDKDGKYHDAESQAKFLNHGTFAANVQFDDGDTGAIMAVAWSEVVGIYTIPYGATAQERSAKAVERLVDSVTRGDEWKRPKDGEEPE